MTDHSKEPELTEAELADLDRFAALASSLSESDAALDTPPPSVWAGIEAGLSADGTDADSAPVDLTTTAATTSPATPAAPDNVIQGPWGKTAPLLLGAVAAVALLFLGAWAFNQDNDRDTIAEVALEFTEGPGFDSLGAASTGNAAVLATGDDRCLDLQLSALPQVDDAYLEVWLIDTNVEGMVSLGPIDGDGCVAIPASVDPSAYPVVDISIEPTDGIPTHSGRSILRGVLDI